VFEAVSFLSGITIGIKLRKKSKHSLPAKGEST
jgi:hypothetical protein